MITKLRDNRGETLIEVLCAVLVSAVSVALLFGAIMASAKIDKRVETQDEQYYNDLTLAEAQKDTCGDTTVTVKNESNKQKEIDIKLYGNERLYSYAKAG